jgi:glycosyltransferase involved in cell wall biosynthesis
MHVISGLDQGGAEAMLVRLLRALDPDVFSQAVVSLTTRGVYGDQIEDHGIPLLTLGMTGFTAAPRGLAVLCRAVREWQPDIVQTWLYHSDLLGLAAARIASDASVAWNVRCSSLAPGDVSRSTRLLTKVLARLSAHPDAVLFNSTAGGEAHRALHYRPRRSEVIPNGFDLEERRPDPVKRAEFRREINVGADTFLVGMIARAHRVKDQTTFLSAAARLKGMSTSISFVMVGLNHTWDNQSLVAEIDRYGLRDRIVLLGLRQDVPRIMAGLDCLVSTSTSEGFPNVIGEAMACGVPCVATDAGDSRLIIGNTGTILPIGDVGGVVGGVSELMDLSAEERQTRSAQCRHRIVEHFELSQIAARYADFYRELNDRRLAWRRGLPVDTNVSTEPAMATRFTMRRPLSPPETPRPLDLQ